MHRRPSRRRGLLLAAALLAPLGALRAAPPLPSPGRVAFLPGGRIAVSDFLSERIVLLDVKTLRVVGRIVPEGRPVGVAWGRSRLYVGNAAASRVDVYRRVRGGVWKRLRSLGGRREPVPEPLDLAVDAGRRRIFVVSGGRREILVFSAAGRLVATLGSGLAHPTALALDRETREVLVSDHGAPEAGVPAAVRIYGYDGALHAVLSGDSGDDGFEFSRPQGLAVGPRGRIFLVDSLLGEVLIFDRATLQGVETLGSYGSEEGQLLLPLDVAIAPVSFDLLVTDNRNARITRFPQGGLVE